MKREKKTFQKKGRERRKCFKGKEERWQNESNRSEKEEEKEIEKEEKERKL